MFLNGVWLFFFFGLKCMDLVLVDVGFLWLFIVGFIVVVWLILIVVFLLFVFYLVWVMMVVLLNFIVLWLNMFG